MSSTGYIPVTYEKNNVLEHVMATITQYPDRTAVVSGEGDLRMTYKEADQRANRLANALAELGVGQGDRVAIFQTNCWQYVEQYVALLKLGAIVVPMNFRLKSPEALYILNDSGAEVLLFEERYLPVLEPSKAYQIGIKHYICTQGQSPDWAYDYESLLSKFNDEPPPPIELGQDDICSICYTSGTTGLPKGSMATHRQLMAAFYDEIMGQELVRGAVNPDPGHVVAMMNVPVYHIAGIAMLYVGMNVGATLVIPDNFTTEGFLQIVQREKVTVTYLVPLMFFFIMLDPKFDEYDLSSLKFIPYGAMPMDPTLLQDILKKFPPHIKYVDAFGSTEVTINITKMPEDHDLSGSEEEVAKKLERLKGIGRPLVHGIESKIVDISGKDVPPGEVGEIVSRGDKVTPGYWRNPAKTAEAIDEDGWFHTGDAAYMDEDGYYYFSDRAGDMINRGGENIFPMEVERVLVQHPNVAETAVFGVPDPAWGQIVAAAVVPQGELPADQELIDFCKQSIASYKAPSHIVRVDQLPRTFEGGKVKKHLLREDFIKQQKGL
jgi:fatty-acyl-CoA synthase